MAPVINSKENKGPIIVVKIGTSTLMRESSTDDSSTVSATAGRKLPVGCGELAVSTLALLVDTLLALRRDGFRVVLVTSGAVGVGCREMGVEKRPQMDPNGTPASRAATMARIQAYAAVGQSVLMQTYDRFMRMAHQPIAQVLLTSTDIGNEYQYANARATLLELLNMGVIPIVNENDSVATEEIKYGDNDWLSALVSTVIEADWLFLLTDVNMVYTANPRNNPNALPIPVVPDINSMNTDFSSRKSGTQWGVGGMNTKIAAARLATAAGIRVVLIHGRHPERVLEFVHRDEKAIGTTFLPHSNPMRGVHRKLISHCLPPKGTVTITAQTAKVLKDGNSIRITGIESVIGTFPPNSAVRIMSEGAEIARGLCIHSSDDLVDYMGKTAAQINELSGVPVNIFFVMKEDLALLVRDDDENEVNCTFKK